MTNYINKITYYFSLFKNVVSYVGNNIGSYPGLVLLITLFVVIFALRMLKTYE